MSNNTTMANYILNETSKKGYGVFAAKDMKQGEHIFHVDLTGFERYTLAELESAAAENPALDGDHANYVGRGKYVIEDTPASYMNHSCDPNCYFKMKSIAVYDVYALRDMTEGEELTHDYTANSVDQFAGQGFWALYSEAVNRARERRRWMRLYEQTTRTEPSLLELMG